jgi:hypothetical protein
MKDVLIDFEENIQVPSWLRLIGLLRIINVIIVLSLLVALVVQTMEMKEFGDYTMFIVTAVITALLGIVGIFSVYYSVRQLRLEFLLSPKCFEQNKFRWSSNVFNIFILFSIVAAFISMPTVEILFPKIFIIFFIAIALKSLLLCFIDLRYFVRQRKIGK